MVKYIVRLNPEERAQLLALVHTGRAAAAKQLHARILRKADVGVDSRLWTDVEIAEALDTSASTVHRVRQPVSNGDWSQRCPVSGRLVDSIANSTEPRKPHSSRWLVVRRQKAGRNGPSSFWTTGWWPWTLSIPSVWSASV